MFINVSYGELLYADQYSPKNYERKKIFLSIVCGMYIVGPNIYRMPKAYLAMGNPNKISILIDCPYACTMNEIPQICQL